MSVYEQNRQVYDMLQGRWMNAKAIAEALGIETAAANIRLRKMLANETLVSTVRKIDRFNVTFYKAGKSFNEVEPSSTWDKKLNLLLKAIGDGATIEEIIYKTGRSYSVIATWCYRFMREGVIERSKVDGVYRYRAVRR